MLAAQDRPANGIFFGCDETQPVFRSCERIEAPDMRAKMGRFAGDAKVGRISCQEPRRLQPRGIWLYEPAWICGIATETHGHGGALCAIRLE